MSKKSDKMFEEAIAQHERGDLRQAERLYAKLLPKRGDDPTLLALLGILYVQMERFDEALAPLKRARLLEAENLDVLNALGKAYLALGRPAEAVGCFLPVLQELPQEAEILCNLAEALAQAGRLGEGVALLEQGSAVHPNNYRVQLLSGELLLAAGDPNQAAARFRAALAVDAGGVAANLRLGTLLYHRGAHAEAVPYLRAALRGGEASEELSLLLGRSLLRSGNAGEGGRFLLAAMERGGWFSAEKVARVAERFDGGELKAAQEALQAEAGRDMESQWRLALLSRMAGDDDGAVEALTGVLERSPDHVGALILLGDVQYDRGARREAIPFYLGALRQVPRNVHARTRLGSAYMELRQFARAEEQFAECVEIAPSMGRAYCNLALSKLKQGPGYSTREELKGLFRKAIQHAPDNAEAHHNLALILLAEGRLEEGWEEYEWRMATSYFVRRPFHYPSWQGEPLDGRTVLVYGEQGVGDELMFAGCIPDLLKRAARCVVECDPRLVTLFQRSFPEALVVARPSDNGVPQELADISIDFVVAAGSLPRFFRRSIDDFPREGGYLKADPERVAYWRDQLGDGDAPRVGISWRSSLSSGYTRAKYPSLEQWRIFLNSSRIRACSLQYDDCAGEIDEYRAARDGSIEYFTDVDLYRDLDEAAALTAAMDLVVSVPNAVAAMAGALGVSTWRVLSGAFLDTFRLGSDGYPWYPEMTSLTPPRGMMFAETAVAALGLMRPLEDDEVAEVSAGQRRGWDALKRGAIHQAVSRFRSAAVTGDRSAIRGVGRVESGIGEPRRAVELLREAVASRDGDRWGWMWLGAAYAKSGDWERAEECLERAVALGAVNGEARAWQCLVDLKRGLRDVDQFREEEWSEIRGDPWLLRAVIDIAAGSVCDGFPSLAERISESLIKEGEGNRRILHLFALVQLAQGRMESGWEWLGRLLPGGKVGKSVAIPDWAGEPLEGKRLLIDGTALSTSRELIYGSCLPEAIARVDGCTIFSDPRLVSLYERSFPTADVVRIDGMAPAEIEALVVGHDFKTTSIGLVKRLRTSFQTFGDGEGYLRADAEGVAAWRRRLNEVGVAPRVGVFLPTSSAGGAGGIGAISPEELRPLIDAVPVTFILLCASEADDGAGSPEENGSEAFPRLQGFNPMNDLDESAALLSSLDFVIAARSPLLYLSAALGVPTAWVRREGEVTEAAGLLFGRPRSPWYPRMRCVTLASEGMSELAAWLAEDRDATSTAALDGGRRDA